MLMPMGDDDGDGDSMAATAPAPAVAGVGVGVRVGVVMTGPEGVYGGSKPLHARSPMTRTNQPTDRTNTQSSSSTNRQRQI